MTNAGDKSELEPERLAALARWLHQEPGHVAELYVSSERFREVYEDYTICQETLERFRTFVQIDEEQVRDYTEMRSQLELELRACVAERTQLDDGKE